MIWPVLFALFLVALTVLYLLNWYGNRARLRWYVGLTAFIGWLFPFCIIVLLPVDLASTLYKRRCPNGMDSVDCNPPVVDVPGTFLYRFWNTIYWTSFCLTWAVIPLMQSYMRSGKFLAKDKVRGAIKENIIYYLVVGAIGAAFLIYVALAKRLTGQSLLSFLIALANGWGLLLIVIFLGHGLIEVPRTLWQNADYHYYLKTLQFKAPLMKEGATDAEADMYEVAKDIASVNKRVGYQDTHLRSRVDRLLAKCPLATSERHYDDAGNIPSGGVTEKYLEQLHVRLKDATKNQDRKDAQWQNLLREAFFLQDMINAEASPEKTLVSTINFNGQPQTFNSILSPTARWWWYIKIKPTLMKMLAIACGIMSACIIWSEVTFPIDKPMLTIFGLILHLPEISYFTLQLISLVTVTYLCICAYSSLFRLKVFNVYALVPNHHTDGGSLLFVAAYLCRLTFPLCYNFLNIVTDQDDTNFVQIMGKVDLVPLLGSTFNKFVPLMIAVICLITAFQLHTKILGACGMITYFENDENDDSTAQMMEGENYIEQARLQHERNIGTRFTRRRNLESPRTSPERIRQSGRIESRLESGLRNEIGNNSPEGQIGIQSGIGNKVENFFSGIFNKIKKPQEDYISLPRASLEQHSNAEDDDVFLPQGVRSNRVFGKREEKVLAKPSPSNLFDDI